MATGDTQGLDRSAIEDIVRRAVYDFMPDVQLGRTADAALSPVPRLVVNISARHIHLNRQAMDVLFGPRSELTVQKDLYQEGVKMPPPLDDNGAIALDVKEHPIGLVLGEA